MSLPAMDAKKTASRGMAFMAVLKGHTNLIRLSRRIVCTVFFIVLALNGQTYAPDGNTCLDENQVHQAMFEEALRLLVQKAGNLHDGSASGFDFHIEQAYEKIKKRLPPDRLSAPELAAWLRQFFQTPAAADADRESQTLIEQFVLGMSLEIINTLQYECDQAEYLLSQVAKLEAELKKTPHADRETLDRALRQSGLSKKTQRIIKNIDRRWFIPPAGADHFSAFNAWKKNMTGQSLDTDQRLAFNLGDRYQAQYPFLDKFMENYRRLAETFQRAVRNLNAMLDSSSDSDFEEPD